MMKPGVPANRTSRKQQICIIAIFRNEAPYIIEWIAHHRLLGIQEFYIADNDSDDESQQILKKLKEAGYCEWIPWITEGDVKPQLPAYRKLLSMLPEPTDWVAFLDADEYIWPTSNISIGDFLRSIPEKTGAIAMNWAVYGSSEHYNYTPEPSTIRFTWHADKTRNANLNFKTLARPNAIIDFTCPHNAILKEGYHHIHTDSTPKTSLLPADRPEEYKHCQSQSLCWEFFRINHYIIRSWSEFIQKKAQRGRAYSRSALKSIYFWGHDFHDKEEIPSPAYTTALETEIDRIERAIGLTTTNKPYCSIACTPPAIVGNIDSVETTDKSLIICGWALEWTRYPINEFELWLNGDRMTEVTHIQPMRRADVKVHHEKANEWCGFKITCTLNPGTRIEILQIVGILTNSVRSEPLVWTTYHQ